MRKKYYQADTNLMNEKDYESSKMEVNSQNNQAETIFLQKTIQESQPKMEIQQNYSLKVLTKNHKNCCKKPQKRKVIQKQVNYASYANLIKITVWKSKRLQQKRNNLENQFKINAKNAEVAQLQKNRPMCPLTKLNCFSQKKSLGNRVGKQKDQMSYIVFNSIEDYFL